MKQNAYKRTMTKKNTGSVVNYHQELKHEFDWEKVKILDAETKYRKRLISGMINIKLKRNSINKKKNSLIKFSLFSSIKSV